MSHRSRTLNNVCMPPMRHHCHMEYSPEYFNVDEATYAPHHHCIPKHCASMYYNTSNSISPSLDDAEKTLFDMTDCKSNFSQIHIAPKPSFGDKPAYSKKITSRRKYNEIDRCYACDFPGCSKSYGKVSHLNAHRDTKKHGPRVSIYDFE